MQIARIALIAALAFVPAAFASDTPSALLEKGIFQEETAGNLDEAVKVYKQIVDEANAARHAVAEAQYRLAVCYQKQGKKDDAQAAFLDLVAKYADENDLVAKAQEELGEAAPARRVAGEVAPAPEAKYEPLELNPAPWPDDELMVMSLKSKANVELGAVFYTAKRLDSHGEPITPTLPPTALADAGLKGDSWRIESYQVIPLNDSRQYTRVDADAITFAPITSRTKNGMGDFHTTYEYQYHANYQSGVGLEVTHDGKPTKLLSWLVGTVYDNEQVIYLLRRLPLKEGYTARFPIFPVMGGAPVECRIRVDGREEMADCGNNRYPCWKVVLSVFSQGVEALQHQLWIEAEGVHRLVKYDSGTAVLQLVPIGAFANLYPMPEESYRLPDADGISIKRVPGWFGYFDHLNPVYSFSLQLLPPDLRCWAVFVGQLRPAEETAARKIAEGDAGKLKGFFKNYAVRADSWSDVTVSGLKGVSFVADYQDNARAMAEYRTYILTPTTVLWFIFRVDKDQFDACRPEFDKIVHSLSAPRWMSGPDADYLTLCMHTLQAAAALPIEVQVNNIECYRLRNGWQLNLQYSGDSQRRLYDIIQERVPAMKNSTIFPEKIHFVTGIGIPGSPMGALSVEVISSEEAGKRQAAAQHEK